MRCPPLVVGDGDVERMSAVDEDEAEGRRPVCGDGG